MKKNILFLLVLFSVLRTVSTAGAAITVGRISYVDGEIYRYMDADDSWVKTFLQSPAGTQDILLTGDKSRAEIVFPNNQLMRLGGNSEIEILNLDEDSGEFTLHSGLARFYNRSSTGEMIVETARGTVKVEPGSAVDVQADEESISVAAVHGEATFHSFHDDVERVEVISGAARLEFQEKSIVAGVGPVDRKWDRWCADREGVLAQNGLVRSEHLPESMQEYAYAMEPYGHWQKIYYRGYYYWAWQPQSVAVGWSPYTTGYWYNWHGSQVWIDHNPWGWVTHHHGNWLNLHGAWLWTPYVHVSHVPGVTVIGFNITFGTRYRSHWHPGRVRWIAHNDYIGWLPLAPRETYYGYRKWGPRSAVAGGGVGFSVNINLSGHRHIDHAVLIPKHRLYNRKPGAINNYKTVRIENINKKTIVKNFRPLHTVQGLREGKHSTKVTGTRDRSILVRRNMQKERIVVAGKHEKNSSSRVEKKYSATLDNTGNKVREKKIRESVVRAEKRAPERTVEKSSRKIVKKRIAVRDNSRKSFIQKADSKERIERQGQVKVETVGKRPVKQERKTVAVRKNGPSRLSQRQVERKQGSAQKIPEGNGKYKEKEKEEGGSQRQVVRSSHNSRKRIASIEKGQYGKRSGKGWYASSLESRH
jgi:hypothetical protein